MTTFVPSFSSFPDVEDKQQESSKERKGRKDKDKARRDSHRKRSRSPRSRSPTREAKRSKHEKRRFEYDDDERVKAKEDRQLEDSDPDSRGKTRDYYVDKRGDVLNISMGGLHKGDIPKFRRSGSTLTVVQSSCLTHTQRRSDSWT